MNIPTDQPASKPSSSQPGDSAAPAPEQRPQRRPAASKPKVAKKGTKRPRAAVGRPKAKGSGMGGLDAAAKILAEAGKPMRCQVLVEKVLAKGLWKTSGKTPAATIHSAVIREIKLKGKESRFKKAGRGLFAAR